MHLKSFKLIKLKKFRDDLLEFNDDVNGDNNFGKSIILEALEIVLNYNHRGRPFNREFSPDLLNQNAVTHVRGTSKSCF